MLRTLIVDDEAPARQRLRRLLGPLAEAERVEVMPPAADGVEALETIRKAPGVDLLLLDIRMPEMTGFDLLGQLAPEERPAVIFTTAYDRYALRAFEENAVDYLLKPIKEDRLDEAVARMEQRRAEEPSVSGERLEELLDWVGTQQQQQQQQQQQAGAGARPEEPPTETTSAEAVPEEEDGYARQISVSLRDRIRLIPTEQVVAVEIHEGITRLFEAYPEGGADEKDGNGLRQHVVDYTLDALEENLDPGRFMRVHRSAIVRLDCIEELVPWRSGRYKLLMKGGHEIVASRERSRRLRERLVI